MKNKIIIILLLTLTAFFPNKGLVYADSSAPIREGTETVLTETQRSEISDWAKNSKIDLEELYERIKNLNPVATRDKLKAEVEAIVNTSAPRSTETLMRYSLNRALMINNDIIEKSVNTNRPGVVDQQVRLFYKISNMGAMRFPFMGSTRSASDESYFCLVDSSSFFASTFL